MHNDDIQEIIDEVLDLLNYSLNNKDWASVEEALELLNENKNNFNEDD